MSEDSNQTSEQIAETAEVIAPKIDTVTLKTGEEIEVYKCKVRHIGLTLGFVLGVFKDLGVVTQEGAEQAIKADLKNPQIILNLIANKAPQVFSLVSEMCALSYDELNELDLDDGLAVTLKVWEVNQRFFLQQVLPLIKSSGLFGSPAYPATQAEISQSPSATLSMQGSRKRKS